MSILDSFKYKGYTILLFDNGTYDILNENGEMVEYDFTELEEAKAYVDIKLQGDV